LSVIILIFIFIALATKKTYKLIKEIKNIGEKNDN